MIRLRLLPLGLALAVAACSTSTPTAPTHAAPQVIAAAPTTPPGEEPAPPATPQPSSDVVSAVRIEPASLVGGAGAVGTVTLTTAAPAGGTVVTLSSSDRDVEVPATVTVLAGQTTITFGISTHPPHSDQTVRITATASGVSQTGELRLLLQTPGARSDEYTVASGGTLVVASPGILDNDTRRGGHDLTAELVMNPMSGTLTLLSTGGFTYRPNAGFSGRDRFIYRPLDGQTYGNQQHVWITVAGPGLNTATFDFTGGVQTFVVPAGITQLHVDVFGAQGGEGRSQGGSIGGVGGLGGHVQATLTVQPGSTLQLYVGGRGNNATFGASPAGTGGGASDIRTSDVLGSRLIVAGGGGGGGGVSTPGSNAGNGGAGGGPVGGAGAAAIGGGGGGGTQSAGGAGGVIGIGANGLPGSFGRGGNGTGGGPGLAGGFNGGGTAFGTAHGTGGGGAFGGGSGAVGNDVGAGGGGGSSFVVAGATNVMHQQGVRSGNGLVMIRW